MRYFRLLLISITHLLIMFAMIYLIMARNEPAWGIIIVITLFSLALTLNMELDRSWYKENCE